MPVRMRFLRRAFPFLLGGAFIEARQLSTGSPQFSPFPFLLGGAFIEAFPSEQVQRLLSTEFPFLLGGAFIEAVG